MRRYGARFTQEELDTLRGFRSEGMSYREISERMGRTAQSLADAMHKPSTRFSNEKLDNEIAEMFRMGMRSKIIGQSVGLSAVAVFQRIKRMKEAGMDLPNPFARKYGLASKAERDPRRASILHLVDLKRAGYSPTQTELLITSERPLARSSYVHQGSLVGSPAAACEAS